jgi:zinc/manganese transport system substrate-binding protein
MNRIRLRIGAMLIALVSIAAFALTSCSSRKTLDSAASSGGRKIIAVGAENEYADIISQIGGKYVSVTGIMSDPSTDPHSYEADTKDASVVSKADLIVENGLGYDDFIDKLISGSPNSSRTVINVAKELGYPNDTANPHLWYKADTMPKVAVQITKDLESKMPDQKQYFEDQLTKFNKSLKTWTNELNQLKQSYTKVGAAVTEPVPDYLLQAAGLAVKTPWAFQAAVMNGTDPSPQDVKTQQDLFKNKQVKVFLYNRQAVDDATTALLNLAKSNNIPIVGVYETMPTHYTYQTWMEAETEAIIKALKNGTSTETLA